MKASAYVHATGARLGMPMSVRRADQVVIASMITLFIWFCVVLYLLVTPASYTATMMIGPASIDTQSRNPLMSNAISMITGALGNSTLFGSSTEDPELTRFIQSTSTVKVAHALIAKKKLDQVVFASQWRDGKWRRPWGPRDIAGTALYSVLGRSYWTPPNDVTLANYIKNNVTFTQIPETEFYSVTYVNKNRDVALGVLRTLYDVTDATIKKDTQASLSVQIAYFEEQLKTTQDVDFRSLYINLLSTLLSQRSLTQINEPFAARLLDPPSAPAQPDRPSVGLTLAIAFVMGPMLAAGLVILISWMLPAKRAAAQTAEANRQEEGEERLSHAEYEEVDSGFR